MGESTHACLPLDTQILTRRGWLSHDMIAPGDETIGYNPEARRSEWTPVTSIDRNASSEIWRIGGTRWYANAALGAKWWSDYRNNMGRGLIRERSGFVRTADFSYGDRLLVASPAKTNGIQGFSVKDAAILAWIQGDGTFYKARRGYGYDGRIYQSKIAQVLRIRSLLADVTHTERIGPLRTRGLNELPEHTFLLRRGYVNSLLERSEVMQTGEANMVLRMSPEQRSSWLDAMIDAEGTHKGGYAIIAQNDGPLADAIQLAVYLEGYRPNVRAYKHKPYQLTIGLGKPYVSVTPFHPHELLERQPAWCVTTENGSWTARQDRRIFLVGGTAA